MGWFPSFSCKWPTIRRSEAVLAMWLPSVSISGFPSNTTPVGAANNEFQSTGNYHTTVAADHTTGLYVQMIYYMTVSRDPDAGGLAFWTGVANSGGAGHTLPGIPAPRHAEPGFH
jgi:hypothetical protein